MINSEQCKNIAGALLGHKVVSVIGNNGVGQTIKLPVYLSSQLDNGQVFVVKTSDISAMIDFTAARSRQDKAAVGFALGSIEDYKSLNKGDEWSTPLVYTTSSYMASLMSVWGRNDSNKDTSICDIIIVDNAFGGNIDSNVLLYIWNELGRAGFRVPRLIMLSSEKSVSPYVDVKSEVISLPSFNNPEIIYSTEPFVAAEAASKTSKVVESCHNSNPVAPRESSTWIVFVANTNDALTIARRLNKYKDIETIILTTSSFQSEQGKKLSVDVSSGRRRIIITNDIGKWCSLKTDIVFDTMTKSIPGRSGCTMITLNDAKHVTSFATQSVWRNVTKCEWNKLTNARTLMNPSSIVDVTLSLININIDPLSFYKRMGASDKSIEEAIEIVSSYNLVDYTSEGYDLTHTGKFVKNLSEYMSLQPLLILKDYLKDPQGSPMTVIIALAIIDQGGILTSPATLYESLTKYLDVVGNNQPNFQSIRKDPGLKAPSVMKVYNVASSIFGNICARYCLKAELDSKATSTINIIDPLIQNVYRWTSHLVVTPKRKGLYSSSFDGNVWSWHKTDSSTLYMFKGSVAKNNQGKAMNVVMLCHPSYNKKESVRISIKSRSKK